MIANGPGVTMKTSNRELQLVWQFGLSFDRIFCALGIRKKECDSQNQNSHFGTQFFCALEVLRDAIDTCLRREHVHRRKTFNKTHWCRISFFCKKQKSCAVSLHWHLKCRRRNSPLCWWCAPVRGEWKHFQLKSFLLKIFCSKHTYCTLYILFAYPGKLCWLCWRANLPR